MLNKLTRNLRVGSRYSGSSGFTLLEALVALVVLSVGLLGIAAMQLKAMQSSHLAYNRSLATLAAQDAVERLWAEFGNPVDGSDSGTCPSPDIIDDPNVDTEWRTNWSGLLPLLTDAAVVADSGDSCKYLITIAWTDERFTGEDVSNLFYIVKLPGK